MGEWFKVASVTPTGSAGSATGTSGAVSASGGNAFRGGILCGVFIDFASAHANTDVTVSEVLPNGALRTLLVTTNVNTDGVYIPKLATHSSAGVASATDLAYPIVGGSFQVDVAGGAGGANEVTVWLLIE